MVTPDSVIRQRIFDKLHVGIEHMLKLYLYSDYNPNDVNGWKQSVWSSFYSVQKSSTGKHKNKYPSKAKLILWSWIAIGDTIEDKYDVWVKRLVDKEENFGTSNFVVDRSF